MQIFKKIIKGVLYSIGGFIAFVLLYVGITYLLFFIPVNRDAALKGPEELSVYVMTNGVHTDIVVPLKNEVMDWTTLTRFENTASKDSIFSYAAFGWGDKGFYLQTPEWSDLKLSVALSAMFHLGSTALHVDFLKTVRPDKNCKEIRISKAEYQKLVRYIKDTFRYDKQGKVIQIINTRGGYGPDDAFYEANGAYDLFNTCNTWANSALKACDQKACWWTVTDRGIFHQYP